MTKGPFSLSLSLPLPLSFVLITFNICLILTLLMFLFYINKYYQSNRKKKEKFIAELIEKPIQYKIQKTIHSYLLAIVLIFIFKDTHPQSLQILCHEGNIGKLFTFSPRQYFNSMFQCSNLEFKQQHLSQILKIFLFFANSLIQPSFLSEKCFIWYSIFNPPFIILPSIISFGQLL